MPCLSTAREDGVFEIPAILPNSQVPLHMLYIRWQLSSLLRANITPINCPKSGKAKTAENYISKPPYRETPWSHPLSFKNWFKTSWTHQNGSSLCTGTLTLKVPAPPLRQGNWNAVNRFIAVATNAYPDTSQPTPAHVNYMSKTTLFFAPPRINWVSGSCSLPKAKIK